MFLTRLLAFPRQPPSHPLWFGRCGVFVLRRQCEQLQFRLESLLVEFPQHQIGRLTRPDPVHKPLMMVVEGEGEDISLEKVSEATKCEC